MRYSGNFKLVQWKMLFIMFKYSLMRSLNIFGTWEGFCFEFQCLEEFEIYLKRLKGAGPIGHWPWAFWLVRTRCPVRPWPPLFHCCHRSTTTGLQPTWARPHRHVGDAAEKFSLPFTPLRLASTLLHCSRAWCSIHRHRMPPPLLVAIQNEHPVHHVPLFK
jgi:hypothetical protein